MSLFRRIYQQDNAVVHVSKSSLTWFKNKKIQLMQWPAKSPDLNPIENLWGDLVRIVYEDCKQYATTEELKIAIKSAWSQIKEDRLRKLVDTLVYLK